MDVYDSMKKIEAEKNTEIANKYASSAKEYMSQGFDEDAIAELLQLEGCPCDLSKIVAEHTISDMPFHYATSTQPESFSDVREMVRESLKNAPFELFEQYFHLHAKKYASVTEDIRLARATNSPSLYAEAERKIINLIDNAIILNNTLASDENYNHPVSDKEQLEEKLFGIWPIYLIRRKAEVEKGDKNLLKKSGFGQNDKIKDI